jgi:ABC-type nitrate/sulfonate/bicarbonate transport system permease component
LKPVTGALARRLGQVLVVLVLLGLWALAVGAEVLDRQLLPPPVEVAEALAERLGSGELWSALLSTLRGAVTGLALAALVGVPLGVVIGMSTRLDRATRLLVDLGRSFPVIALLPVMVLILGASERMKVVVVFLGCVWPILVQSLYGARRLEPVIADTVRAYRTPHHLRFLKVALPSATPYVATGIRVAAAGAVLISVAVEVLSQTPGLGRQIALAQQGGSGAVSVAYVFCAGVLGLTINSVLVAVESRFLGWHRRGTGGGTR